jgi:hypothetical protein
MPLLPCAPDSEAAATKFRTDQFMKDQSEKPPPSWQLPDQTFLALVPAELSAALAVDRAMLTVWQLSPGAATWVRAQVVNVPIPYGSST